MVWHKDRGPRVETGKVFGSLDHPEAPRAKGKSVPPNPSGLRNVESMHTLLDSDTDEHDIAPRTPGEIAISSTITIQSDEQEI